MDRTGPKINFTVQQTSVLQSGAFVTASRALRLSCCNHYSRVFGTESITVWHNTAVLGLGVKDDWKKTISQSKQK